MKFNSIEEAKLYYENKISDIYNQMDFIKDILIDTLNEKYQLELKLQNNQGDDNMTTYNPFNEFDMVELKERTEIKNCFYLDKGVKGVVKDATCPDYYLVNFEGHGAYWVSGKHLIKNKGVDNMKTHYFEIECYDESFTGCWKSNNKFNTLKEAVKFIDDGNCPSGVNLRIICKTEEQIEIYNRKNK